MPARPERAERASGGELPFEDYRSSHLEKGDEYHRSFKDSVYRATMWELEQAVLLDLLARHFGPSARVRLLDFACGTGRVLSLLEGRVSEATGVDVAPSMLAVAARLLRSARLVCCDITRTGELDEARFDLIVAFRFFPNAEPALREEAMAKLGSLLAGGGLLVFNNHLRCGGLLNRWRAVAGRLGLIRKIRHRHCMSDAEAVGLAARHGLDLVEEHHLGVLPIRKERRPLLPAWLIRLLERLAARSKVLAPIARYKIYAFRRTSACHP